MPVSRGRTMPRAALQGSALRARERGFAVGSDHGASQRLAGQELRDCPMPKLRVDLRLRAELVKLR